jgi:hypothetical protein
MQIEPLKLFKEYNDLNDKIHLKEILQVGYKGLIPTNVILNKTLPGLGATSCEIECERNSIIIEPNVPVIDGKMNKYPNERWPYPILGVRKGVKISTIQAYLLNKSIPFKKILTTPESYISKVQVAFNDLNIINYKEDYFLLLDESEKFIQDTDFRKSLFEVMNDFWKFNNKAMVSATPLIPHGKGFIEQEFRIIKVLPQFNYKKPITVITTNSVLDCVKQVYNEDITTDTICFFVNSITMIDNIIKHLGLKEQSRIFCSEDSLPRIKELGYTDYSTVIEHTNGLAELNRVNFFTSRFFSAVDIDLADNNVSVIIATDNYVAPHSAVDPFTHVKQIIGRFRNKTQFNCLISNTKDNITYRTKEDILNYTRGSHSAFKAIHTLYLKETNPIVKIAFKDALYQLKFRDYTYLYEGKLVINWLLIDNEIEDEKVKALYTHPDTLKKAFQLEPFYETTPLTKLYKSDDKLRYQISQLNLKALRESMVDTFYGIINCEIEGLIEDHFTEYELQKEGGYILGVAQYLEREDLERYDYDPDILDPILDVILNRDITENLYFRKAIRSQFKKGVRYSRGAIRARLESLFQKFNIDVSFKATRLADYCTLSEEVNIGLNGVKLPGEKRPKGYIVKEHLFSISE